MSSYTTHEHEYPLVCSRLVGLRGTNNPREPAKRVVLDGRLGLVLPLAEIDKNVLEWNVLLVEDSGNALHGGGGVMAVELEDHFGRFLVELRGVI